MINSKEELFQTLCNASRLDTLGLFVGAGFSKAVLENNTTYTAYSWGELLEKCSEELGVEKDAASSKRSYPEVATQLCKNYSEEKGKGYEESVKIFKEKICELTNSYPEQGKREEYSKLFGGISPRWIVTTNYDTLIENVLGGEAMPISPTGCFCNVHGTIPVFHLHGICSEPENIVITSEDYAHMFRPSDYRQARLPFLMKESCVLMIGYGLGDINVITAVDWANNVYTNVSENYEFPIIQLVYTETPREEPFLSAEGVVIFEIDDLSSFLKELCAFRQKYEREYEEKLEKIQEYTDIFNSADEVSINSFINNTAEYRNDILMFFASLEPEFGFAYNSFFVFLKEVINRLDILALPDGAFEAYDQKLCLILDILIKIPVGKIPPSIFGVLANQLNYVGYYVNPDGEYSLGKSYRATDSWKERKSTIPKDTVSALWRFVNYDGFIYYNLYELLQSISMEQEQ